MCDKSWVILDYFGYFAAILVPISAYRLSILAKECQHVEGTIIMGFFSTGSLLWSFFFGKCFDYLYLKTVENKTQKNWAQDRSQMLLRLLTLKNSLKAFNAQMLIKLLMLIMLLKLLLISVKNAPWTFFVIISKHV